MSTVARMSVEGDTQLPESERLEPRGAFPVPRPPILSEADVSCRMLLLAELHSALAGLGVHCVLARNHRLVLQYNRSQCEPSGLTDPQLHIFTADGTYVATTDGSAYHFAHGASCPAGDPDAAATVIVHRHRMAQ